MVWVRYGYCYGYGIRRQTAPHPHITARLHVFTCITMYMYGYDGYDGYDFDDGYDGYIRTY